MLSALLAMYRVKCRSEQRQQETIQSLLDRLYGRKSEKSKYHPDQKLLLPELLEELIDEAVGASEPAAESSDSKAENDRSTDG